MVGGEKQSCQNHTLPQTHLKLVPSVGKSRMQMSLASEDPEKGSLRSASWFCSLSPDSLIHLPKEAEPDSPALECGLHLVTHSSCVEGGRNDGMWLLGKAIKACGFSSLTVLDHSRQGKPAAVLWGPTSIPVGRPPAGSLMRASGSPPALSSLQTETSRWAATSWEISSQNPSGFLTCGNLVRSKVLF